MCVIKMRIFSRAFLIKNCCYLCVCDVLIVRLSELFELFASVTKQRKSR